MNVLIFGATGRTGRHLVDQALEAGHTVTAFARYPNRIHREHERLRIVEGHVQDQIPVLEAVEGQDAVISTLGQVRERPTVAHILTVAATNITEAMKFHDVRRLVFLVGAGVDDSQDKPSFASRLILPLMRLLAGHVLQDAEDAVERIRSSDLDWTIVRVTRLDDEPPKGDLTAGFHKPGFSPVSRVDVATFMLDQLESDRYLRQAPIISYDRE
jgi:putative NADH-flavin reductase